MCSTRIYVSCYHDEEIRKVFNCPRAVGIGGAGLPPSSWQICYVTLFHQVWEGEGPPSYYSPPHPTPDFQTFLRPFVGSEVLDHAHGSAIICTRVILIMMKVKNAHHLIIKWYRSLISIPYRNSTYAFRSLHCMTHLMRNIFFPSSKDDSLKIDAIHVTKENRDWNCYYSPKNWIFEQKMLQNLWNLKALNRSFKWTIYNPRTFQKRLLVGSKYLQ